jgi:VWFA-related protein
MKPTVSAALPATIGAWLVLSPVVWSQAPTFPSRVDAVTVDVVVLDKKGQPVSGLTQEDFLLSEDGAPQSITTFDAVVVPDAPKPETVRRTNISTNVASASRQGRTFILLFDDVHLTPVQAYRAKIATASFLKTGVRPGDKVTLVASGGAAWWSASVPEGQEELLSILKRLDGRYIPDLSPERMTDYEAMRIYVYHDTMVASRVQQRFEAYGTKSRQDAETMRGQQQGRAMGAIDPYIENRASETYLRTLPRSRATLGLLTRILKALSAGTDRKALVLISEGFVYDPSEVSFQEVTEAARRANANVYFLDTRGLEVASLYSAQFGALPSEGPDRMSAIADTSQEGEGAEVLARDTGGFSVRNTNDLNPGVLRIGQDSRNYYLLGFDPPADAPRDGRFRRITVKVRGKSLSIRARKGYYAPRDGPAPSPEVAEKGDPEIQRAIDSPYLASEIPLRATAYVLQETTLGKAHVLVAADIDVSGVEFRETDGKNTGSLDLLVAVTDRKGGEIQRSDQKVDLERKPGSRGATWYSIVREFDLPPAAYQSRIVVRDVSSRRLGTVTYEFEVPRLDQWRVSTPVITDAVQQPPGQSAIVPVLLARRDFAARGILYCSFDVTGAAKDKGTGMPRVSSGHTLRRSDGTVVSRNEPTPILPGSLGAISRMIGIPLDGVTPGDYELVLKVRDDLAGRSQELVEPIQIR